MLIITVIVNIRTPHDVTRSVGRNFNRYVGCRFFVSRINIHIARNATVIFFRNRPPHKRISVHTHFRVVFIGYIYSFFPICNLFFLSGRTVKEEENDIEFCFFKISDITSCFVNAEVFSLGIRISVTPPDKSISRFRYCNNGICVTAANNRLFRITLNMPAVTCRICKYTIDFFNVDDYRIFESSVTDKYFLLRIGSYVQSFVNHTRQCDGFCFPVAVSNRQINFIKTASRADFVVGILYTYYFGSVCFYLLRRRQKNQ